MTRIEFAVASSRMAFHAWSFYRLEEGHDPLQGVPPDWSPREVLRRTPGGGLARECLRFFAIARALDAYRGDPPVFDDAHTNACARICRDAAATLDTFDQENVQAAVLTLFDSLTGETRYNGEAVPDTPFVRMLRMMAGRVAAARNHLARLPALAPDYLDASGLFPPLLARSPKEREDGLRDQALLLRDAGVSYWQIGHVMGCGCHDRVKTRDRARKRLEAHENHQEPAQRLRTA